MTRFSELRYINRFRCVGSACPDHCCRDWQIDIDPDTERRYRRLEDSPLKQSITENLKRRRCGDKKRTFIQLKPDGVCPMHDDDGLCRIQKTLGESYLSRTCDTFPRLRTGTETHGFRAGTVACPAVARDVLQSPDAMAEVVCGDGPGWAPGVAAAPASGPALSIDEMAAVRTSMLAILTATGQPWAGRVTLATLFCRDLAGIDLVRDRGALLVLTMRMHDVVATADLGQAVADDPDAPDLLRRSRLGMLRRILASQEDWWGRHLAPFVHKALDGLAMEGTEPAQMADRLARLDRERLWPALEARPHLAGNLLANLLLQRAFPTGRPRQAMRQLWEAGLCFTLWRILAAGHLAHDDAPFDDVALEVTWRIGRMLMHNARLLVGLHDVLEKSDMTTDPTLVALLR